jgi:hypothetical protein
MLPDWRLSICSEYMETVCFSEKLLAIYQVTIKFRNPEHHIRVSYLAGLAHYYKIINNVHDIWQFTRTEFGFQNMLIKSEAVSNEMKTCEHLDKAESRPQTDISR